MSERKEFLKLAKIEPRLLVLEAAIMMVDGTKEDFCASYVWYKTYKPMLRDLVGCEPCCVHIDTIKAELQTSTAWDIAYDYLFNLLPDCDHGDSMCIGIRDDESESENGIHAIYKAAFDVLTIWNIQFGKRWERRMTGGNVQPLKEIIPEQGSLFDFENERKTIPPVEREDSGRTKAS